MYDRSTHLIKKLRVVMVTIHCHACVYIISTINITLCKLKIFEEPFPIHVRTI
jgi:hypothetical protein